MLQKLERLLVFLLPYWLLSLKPALCTAFACSRRQVRQRNPSLRAADGLARRFPSAGWQEPWLRCSTT